MKIYLITGPGFHVGPGAALLLLAESVGDRRHQLEDVRVIDGVAFARTIAVQNFIAGEMLGMTDVPIGMAGLVQQLEAADPPSAAAKLLAAVSAFATQVRKDQKKADHAARVAADGAAKMAAAAADAADKKRWTEEWDSVELVRKHHKGDIKAFFAAKRAEREKISAEVAKAEEERAAQAEADRGRAAAEARAAQEKGWSEEFAASDDLKAQFKTPETYIADRRKAQQTLV